MLKALKRLAYLLKLMSQLITVYDILEDVNLRKRPI